MSSNKKELENEMISMNMIISNLSLQLENAKKRKEELSIELLKIQIRSDIEEELNLSLLLLDDFEEIIDFREIIKEKSKLK